MKLRVIRLNFVALVISVFVGGELLTGFVDLYAHPMTHLAFGGKIMQGAPVVGSPMPIDSIL